eukprot:5138612-Amphidinium_carterae.1
MGKETGRPRAMRGGQSEAIYKLQAGLVATLAASERAIGKSWYSCNVPLPAWSLEEPVSASVVCTTRHATGQPCALVCGVVLYAVSWSDECGWLRLPPVGALMRSSGALRAASSACVLASSDWCQSTEYPSDFAAVVSTVVGCRWPLYPGTCAALVQPSGLQLRFPSNAPNWGRARPVAADGIGSSRWCMAYSWRLPECVSKGVHWPHP